MSETTDIPETPPPAAPLPVRPTSWNELTALHPIIAAEANASDPPGHGARDPGDSHGFLNPPDEVQP